MAGSVWPRQTGRAKIQPISRQHPAAAGGFVAAGLQWTVADLGFELGGGKLFSIKLCVLTNYL